MKKKTARKQPGRPRGRNNKVKASFTISRESRIAVDKEAKRLHVSAAQVVDRCLRCQLMKDCETPCDEA